jgi:hypothetical protein
VTYFFQCCGSRIRDPGLGAFLTQVTGMNHLDDVLELINHFFCFFGG